VRADAGGRLESQGAALAPQRLADQPARVDRGERRIEARPGGGADIAVSFSSLMDACAARRYIIAPCRRIISRANRVHPTTPDTRHRIRGDLAPGDDGSRGFFTEMPQAGGLGTARLPGRMRGLNALGTLLVGWHLGGAFASFIWLVVGGFVSAAALTLVAQHLFEGRAGFEPTFRVVAYAAAPIVLFWVPRLWVLALLYGWYLQIRGVERVNEFEPTPGVLTVAIKTGALILLAAGLRGWRP
jgi:hypothetical protein